MAGDSCFCCGDPYEDTVRLDGTTNTLNVPTNSRVCIALEPKPRAYLHDKIPLELEDGTRL